MENNIKILRNKFSKLPFFVRVFQQNKKILIWNDFDIKFSIQLDDLLKYNIDEFVSKTKEIFSKNIEEKYSKIKSRKISVIIPNYNNEKTLPMTINSVLNNNYSDIEIIVVDDCSTDHSVEVVRKNFGDNPKVNLIINSENRGTYYCRNMGILNSSGYYITIVDGDDYIDKDKYIFEQNYLEKLKVWGFGTGYERIYYENELTNVIKKEHLKTWLPKYLFYRKLFNYIGFFQNNRFGADSEFVVRAQKFGFPIKDLPNKVFYHAYTTNGKNLTKIYSGAQRRVWFERRKKIIDQRDYIEMAFIDNEKDFFNLIKS